LFRSRTENGEAIDVQDVFGRFTLDAAGEFLFGTNQLNTLDMALPLPSKKAKLGPKGTVAEGDYGGFVTALEEIQSKIGDRGRRTVFWPLFEFFADACNADNATIDAWVGRNVSSSFRLSLSTSSFQSPSTTGS
jgi:hypothetical protein